MDLRILLRIFLISKEKFAGKLTDMARLLIFGGLEGKEVEYQSILEVARFTLTGAFSKE